MFEYFIDLQDRILAIAARSETILLAPDNRDASALSGARWEIARALREYQLFKHTSIFDRFADRNDCRGSKARAMKAECIRVDEEFRQYLLKWSAVSILDHWSEYRPAALDAIARIRTQLARERDGVAELLDVQHVA